MAHGHPLFAFRAIDLDKEPGLARDVGVRAYNTAVLQAGGRTVLVENTTDAARIAYAAMRVLKERVETVCLMRWPSPSSSLYRVRAGSRRGYSENAPGWDGTPRHDR